MAALHVLKGPLPSPGAILELAESGQDIGRAPDAGIVLSDRGVSRRHAKIYQRDGNWFLEDLGSSNGTHVNGVRVQQPVQLHSGDQLQLGPFTLRFTDESTKSEHASIVSQTKAGPGSEELFQDASGRRLRAMLELTRSLGTVAGQEQWFPRVAGQLFQLFAGADRILMLEGSPAALQVTGSEMRGGGETVNQSFSRSLLRRVLTENIGLVASQPMEVRGMAGQSLMELGVESFMCAPLHDEAGKPIGALLLDRFRPGKPFPHDDLMLLTTIAIQVSISLQNQRFQTRLLDQARLQRDLALAREIQKAYLPTVAPTSLGEIHEVAAMLNPAQEVAGDFYDYFPNDDGTCLLVIGDVTGKGITAALFLTSVRTLLRHLASTTGDPGVLMFRLNNAIAADNPNGMFVTLVLAQVEVATGRVILAMGGHPAPVLFKPGVGAAPIPGPTGRLIGYAGMQRAVPTVTVNLQPGEALLFYTDGVTEANSQRESPPLFGEKRLCDLLAAQRPDLSLDRIHCNLCDELENFSGSPVMEDDVTLMSIRRRA